MKLLATVLLVLVSGLAAAGQQSSYDPAARQPSKQREGFVDFALKQVNPQNKDYGCQVNDARKLLVDETIKNITSWAVWISFSFLIVSFFILFHQHKERNRREIIAAHLLAQYHNALAGARSQAEDVTRRYNALVNRINIAAEASPGTPLRPPGHAQAAPAGTNPRHETKPQSAPAPQTKNNNKSKGTGTSSAEPKPKRCEPEPDLIAQISTLQQQLTAAHDREKNLQKELKKAQRRTPVASAEETNIAG